MRAFVGTHRYIAHDMSESIIGPGGKWLLDQLHPSRLARGEQGHQITLGPGLVGVGDEPSVRS